MLLRSDIHRLFDRGYVTVKPDFRVVVSDRLKKDWANGEYYRTFEGMQIWLPPGPEDKPNREFLEWHSDTVFLAS